MHRLRTIVLVWALGAGVLCAQERAANPAPTGFRAVDVFVDSGAQPLAAYQLDFSARAGSVKIVGIEGGEHPAFKEPPYYDPKAIQQERAVLAAFNTVPAGQLPAGRTRVATIHVQVSGETAPKFTAKIQAAAGSDGRSIPVQITLMERKAR